ncbi:sigma-70 family RNA polymerase sigma factor [Corynebacterium sp. TAE3-ERU2]|uniref:sigma-70 family RNA polymerase sigma factor n=1 Tax=Corynebacterium sp. TAE3-ERU2 TaxID=2849497 RepID=UPI001C443B84|nr:sigma-70 family RNA polymerase sigma factor [Corynebacterium sp. TAE3-ERU2]
MPNVKSHLDALLEATSRGDVQAFEQLFTLLHKRVYGLTLRILTDRNLAEDAAHEAWLSVWENSSSFDPHKGSAEGWVLAMAHRRAVDVVRSREAHHRRSAEYAQSMSLTESVDAADAHLLRIDEHAELAECCEQLTAKQRQALALTYFEGLTYQEVADRLGVSHSAIKTRLRDAMKTLRRCMDS